MPDTSLGYSVSTYNAPAYTPPGLDGTNRNNACAVNGRAPYLDMKLQRYFHVVANLAQRKEDVSPRLTTWKKSSYYPRAQLIAAPDKGHLSPRYA